MRESEQERIFAEWRGAHKGLFYKVVRAYAFTPQDQEDLFQEIAVQVWRSIPAYRGESAVTTWIYKVALRSDRLDAPGTASSCGQAAGCD